MREATARAIVVGQRKVRSVGYARGVGGEIGSHAVRATGTMRRASVELSLQRTHESGKEIQKQAAASMTMCAQIILHQRAEDDRAQISLPLPRPH